MCLTPIAARERHDAAVPADWEQQLDQIVGLVRDVLGPDVLGAYLFGSATLGGLRPRSDVDVLVVSKRPTTRAEKQRLVDGLLTISGRRNPSATPRPVELTIVVESEVRPWRYPPSYDLQYGEWWRDEFERGDIEPWPKEPNPDLASLIAMVLLADRPLVGPPPAEVFDPVPRDDYGKAMRSAVEDVLRGLGDDTRNMLLTLARIWSSLATGDIRSKDDAAAWALDRLPEEHRAVLARARAVYLGEEEERWDDLAPRLRPHADYVVAEIERLAPSS
jgi:predicted nucleotidyltransferase